jgi:hypothetical protein
MTDLSSFAPVELLDAVDALRRQVAALTDRAAIGDLIDRFSRDLDDFTLAGRPFDTAWVRAYFTDDASVEYPVGAARGAEAIAELIDGRGMAPFQRTHHVTTNYVLEFDPDVGPDGAVDRADVRFNLIATHVHAEDVRLRRGDPPGAHFTVGDYYEGQVVRTPAGWRFHRQALHVTWTEGQGPG